MSASVDKKQELETDLRMVDKEIASLRITREHEADKLRKLSDRESRIDVTMAEGRDRFEAAMEVCGKMVAGQAEDSTRVSAALAEAKKTADVLADEHARLERNIAHQSIEHKAALTKLKADAAQRRRDVAQTEDASRQQQHTTLQNLHQIIEDKRENVNSMKRTIREEELAQATELAGAEDQISEVRQAVATEAADLTKQTEPLREEFLSLTVKIVETEQRLHDAQGTRVQTATNAMKTERCKRETQGEVDGLRADVGAMSRSVEARKDGLRVGKVASEQRFCEREAAAKDAALVSMQEKVSARIEDEAAQLQAAAALRALGETTAASYAALSAIATGIQTASSTRLKHLESLESLRTQQACDINNFDAVIASQALLGEELTAKLRSVA